MNIAYIAHFFVGFMVSEIPIVSDGHYGHCPYSGTVHIRLPYPKSHTSGVVGGQAG